MELTQEQLVALRKQQAAIMFHNGNVAYRIWTGAVRPNAIRITCITAPVDSIPKEVGFVDPELIGIKAANDETNPDGSFPKELTPIAKAKAKRPGLKLVK